MNIYCLGAAHIDIKAFTKVKPLCGESIPVTTTSCHGGVIRNVAENLASFGAKPFLLSIVGADSHGKELLDYLKQTGVDVKDVMISQTFPTAKYTALLDPQGELFVATADMNIYEELTQNVVLEKTAKRKEILDWVLDANLPQETLKSVVKHAHSNQRLWAIGVSSAKVSRFKESLPDLEGIFLNEKEFKTLTNQSEIDLEWLLKKGTKQVVVTLGEDGVLFNSGERIKFLPCPKVDIVEVTGAGDAFSAGVIYQLILGKEIEEAIRFGFSAAKKTLTSIHSSLVGCAS